MMKVYAEVKGGKKVAALKEASRNGRGFRGSQARPVGNERGRSASPRRGNERGRSASPNRGSRRG